MKDVSIKCLRHFFTASILSLVLAACGGSGGDSPPADQLDTPTISKTGVFLDSAVAGVAYQTETKSGVTNAAGEYDYVEGETVTFSIGGIVLGSATAGPVVTPVTLVNGATDATDPVVKNIIRLLVTFDADGNPDNGIDVTAAAAAAAGSTVSVTSATFDTDVAALVATVNGAGATLVDETIAINHFNETLQTSWGTSVWGTDCWGTVCS